MKRPARPAVLPEKPKRGGSYVSPYGVRGGSTNTRSPVGSRNLSNNSQKNRFVYKSPGAQAGYTPPGRKAGASPAGSAGSRNLSNNRPGNRFNSPQGNQTTGNRVRPGQANNRFSPNASNGSATLNRNAGKSPSQSGASNRLYSPSGRMRLSGSNNMGDGGSPQGY